MASACAFDAAVERVAVAAGLWVVFRVFRLAVARARDGAFLLTTLVAGFFATRRAEAFLGVDFFLFMVSSLVQDGPTRNRLSARRG